MRTQRFGLVALLSLFGIFASVPIHNHGLQARLWAQDQHNHTAADAQDKATPGAGQGMMATMAATDAKLDELVRAMNAAKGDKKVDAMAAVLTALVEQHRSMRASMANGMGGNGPMMNGTKMNGTKMMGGMPAPGANKDDAPKK